MPLLQIFFRHLTPFIAILLVSLLPTASADGDAAAAVDTVAFWLAFCLLVVIPAAESALSIFWTRFRITSDNVHPCELSCRIWGREIYVTPIDADTASTIATKGLPAGCYYGTTSSVTVTSGNNTSSMERASGCSSCGGWENKDQKVYGNTIEAVIDKFGSLMLVPTLIIRRFNPASSLEAPAGLVDNAKDLLKPGLEKTVMRGLEHAIHIFVSLTDVSLGVAVLILIPGSPQKLYATLKDPKAAMTFENYSTLVLIYWLLGAVMVVCMIPLRSKRKSIQVFGWPGAIAQGIAGLANLALFGLGCWKIDYARRHHLPWSPMLSYWIGGASAIGFPMCGFEVFHIFGFVGLVFMLIQAFE